MTPISFVFFVIQYWLSGSNPEQIQDILQKAETDYESSKIKIFLDRFPYFLILLPILAPIGKIYFNKFMQKIVTDADGDGDEDLYDMLLMMVGKMAKKRPASELAKQFQALQFGEQ